MRRVVAPDAHRVGVAMKQHRQRRAPRARAEDRYRRFGLRHVLSMTAARASSGLDTRWLRTSSLLDLVLLLLQGRLLLLVECLEIDWVDQELREAALADQVIDRLAYERKQDVRAADLERARERLAGNTGDAENTRLVHLDEKQRALRLLGRGGD